MAIANSGNGALLSGYFTHSFHITFAGNKSGKKRPSAHILKRSLTADWVLPAEHIKVEPKPIASGGFAEVIISSHNFHHSYLI
jgi:hypothetical protein